MSGVALEPLAAGGASWKASAPASPPVLDRGSFGAAMAAVDLTKLIPAASSAVSAGRPLDAAGAGLGGLARHLDQVGRHRLEAQTLSEQLARGWGSDVDPSVLAVSMHRQARALASYNISVMWGAKLVGVTAGALRQLVSAS
jgi:hypothetical protein